MFGMDSSGQEALPEGLEVSGGTSIGMCKVTSVWEAIPVGSDGSGRTLGGIGGFGSPFHRARSGLEAFPEGRKGLGGTSGVGSLPKRALRGEEAHPKGQEWSGVPLGGLGGVGRHSQCAGSGQESLPEAERVWEAIPDSREGSAVPKHGLEGTGGPPAEPGGVRMLSWRARGAERPYWRAGRVEEGQEKSGVPPGETGGVGKPTWRAVRGLTLKAFRSLS